MSGTEADLMYGRPSVMESDMHYGRPRVMECEYHAYVCKYNHLFAAESETIYHKRYDPWNGPSSINL